LFAGESPPEVMTKHVLEGPQFAVGWAEGLPEGVEAVLLKALAKEPTERYATAGEFVEALQEVGKAEAIEERKEARSEAQVLLETGKRLEEQGELQAALTVYRQAQGLAAVHPESLTEINVRVRDLEQRAAYVAQAESLRSALERTAPFVTPLPMGEGLGVMAEPRRRNWLWVGLGGLLVLAAGLALMVGLLILGMRGDGPLAALATATPYPVEITDAYGVAMRLVPAGEFNMGSDADDALAECQKFRSYCKRDWFTNEEPAHTVYLDAFYMDKYEVTNAQYAACVAAGRCTPPHEDSSSDRSRYYGEAAFENYPVIKVDWDQAKTYCEWRGARLPTEAEWEKAARGTDGRVYPWGNYAPTCLLANFDPSGGTECVGDTSAVGSYPEGISPYGIYDLAGNVWEWVADWYDANYYTSSPSRNPAGPAMGTRRVLRGGSWYDYEYHLRASLRLRNGPDLWNNYVGFRCSRSP
jgi:formylglycine-generating enzyme required for sulfatase activity